jgi:acyl carrier protein
MPATLDKLASELCKTFEWESLPPPSQRLVDDLGLDSLDLFFIVVLVEELAGLDSPSADYPQLVTAGDIVTYFETLRRGILDVDERS